MANKTFKIKLTNPDGAKTGCRFMTLSISAPDRKTAQTAALAHAHKTNPVWRLHDDEQQKS